MAKCDIYIELRLSTNGAIFKKVENSRRILAARSLEIIESLSMMLTENGRRQKLNFLAPVLSRLYTKVKYLHLP